MFRVARLSVIATLAVSGVANPAENLDGREIVDRTEKLLWGKTFQGELEMSIATPRWQRTLTLDVWIERPRQSFIRILSPAKEAGVGSLRIGSEMWNYLPKIERTIKIPPSMMLQPWMGSDFTNDDLVKESSVVDDYVHQIVRTESADGATTYVIEAIPKAEAAVVWGKIVFWVRQADFVPLREEFYSERGELVRVLTFSEVRSLDGRMVPTRWEMRPQDKPSNATIVVLKHARYDQRIDPETFTQRNLQKP